MFNIFDYESLKTLNWFSFFADVLLFLILTNFTLHKPRKMARFSLQIQIALVFLSMIRHILMAMEPRKNTSICSFVGFYQYFIDHLYIFFNVSIAVNLHLVYLNSFETTTGYKVKLWLMPICVALVIDLGSYAFGAFGRNSLGQCLIKDKSIKDTCFGILLNYIMTIPALSYCLLISLRVGLGRANRGLTNQLNFINEETSFDSRILRMVSSLARRISIYPFNCVVIYTVIIISRIAYDLTSTKNETLELWGYIGLSCTSILACLSLLLDPGFQSLLGFNKGFSSLGSPPKATFTFTAADVETLLHTRHVSDASLLQDATESSKAKWARDYCRLLLFRRL
ncbi:hypothetical protein DSO57_1036218 [Entomophthora muscae]|uniref:Uncharacterized protein n=1 Tax=Entomophthora muscae TaxID=34485 RepID=A0ACC2ULA3_9FUNG|nr:hypothetical protein DSO57_1036218 [Entomophthora muscae]